MDQQFREIAALLEDFVLIPSTYEEAHNCLSLQSQEI